jgi:hypothetical protein
VLLILFPEQQVLISTYFVSIWRRSIPDLRFLAICLIVLTIFFLIDPLKRLRSTIAWRNKKSVNAGTEIPTTGLEGHENQSQSWSKLRAFGRSVALAFWSTIIGFSTAVWLCSVYHAHNSDLLFVVILFIAAIVILIATFFLEGLEASYLELRDKDPSQLQGRAKGEFDRISALQEHGEFLESREWSVVALVVITTLMVDIDPYYWIPGYGQVVSDGPHGHVVRIALTLVLSTLPFIWFAQSPGKHVAGRNSAQFLKYLPTRAAVFVLKWFVRPTMKVTGLFCPSNFTDELALIIMKYSQSARLLLPSEYGFFTDGLKKYGYGVPIMDDSITINPDGSICLTTRLMAYVINPRAQISRKHLFEEGFKEGTVDSLERNSSEKTRWRIYSVPMIGEKVSDNVLSEWATIFYDERARAGNTPSTYREVKSDYFFVKGEIQQLLDEKTHETEEELHISLNFRKDYPDEEGRALLVIWDVSFETLPGTVKLLEKFGQTSKYPYSKTHSHPCLRSTITLRLKANDFIFVESKEDDHWSVKYNESLHAIESERFKHQKRSELKPIISEVRSTIGDIEEKSDQPTLTFPVKTSEPGPHFVYYIDSPLPAAIYKVHLWIERASREPRITPLPEQSTSSRAINE